MNKPSAITLYDAVVSPEWTWFGLDGKIAIVSGGDSGIGRAAAKEGACVFITARRELELAEAVKEIGANATVCQEVSNLGADIVFANAGIAKYALMGKITEELYERPRRPYVHSHGHGPRISRIAEFE